MGSVGDAVTDKEQLVRALIKPLVWHEGDERDEWKSGYYEIWCEFGKYQLYWWAVVVGDPHETVGAAKASAEAHHIARTSAALNLDAVATLVNAANAYKDERIKVDDTLAFCALVSALTKFAGEPK